MTVEELRNILRSYHPEDEILISSSENLWSLELSSMREATLYETGSGVVVDQEDYDKDKDGVILSTRQVVLIDLDL